MYIHDDCKRFRCSHYKTKKYIKEELEEYYCIYEELENKIKSLEKALLYQEMALLKNMMKK